MSISIRSKALIVLSIAGVTAAAHAQPVQLRRFGGSEELAGITLRPPQPAGAKIVGPAFDEHGFEWRVLKDALNVRNIFVEKLFLEIDRVRGNDDPLFLLHPRQHGRHEIRITFTDTRPGLDCQMPASQQRVRNGFGHPLLRFAKLKMFVRGKQPGRREEIADGFRQRGRVFFSF